MLTSFAVTECLLPEPYAHRNSASYEVVMLLAIWVAGRPVTPEEAPKVLTRKGAPFKVQVYQKELFNFFKSCLDVDPDKRPPAYNWHAVRFFFRRLPWGSRVPSD
jgi:hypothetical protein